MRGLYATPPESSGARPTNRILLRRGIIYATICKRYDPFSYTNEENHEKCKFNIDSRPIFQSYIYIYLFRSLLPPLFIAVSFPHRHCSSRKRVAYHDHGSNLT